MGDNYIGEFVVALGAIFTSALLRMSQVRQAKIRNRISPIADNQTLIARSGLLTADLLFVPAGFALLNFR
jgi:hypothetical protein